MISETTCDLEFSPFIRNIVLGLSCVLETLLFDVLGSTISSHITNLVAERLPKKN